jgi:D-3-phosphoglycerate dehydrogenase/C-terminal binding protein
MKMKVPITDYVAPPAKFEEAVLSEVAQVVCLQQTDEAGLRGKIEDADGLIVFHTIVMTSRSIDWLTRCRAIVRCGAGFENVDLAAAGSKGIAVCNVPDYGIDEVADHAMALTLACSRGLGFTEKRLRKRLKPWNHHAVPKLYRLAGGIFGVIGLGRIGTATAMRAKALRMRVVACDPYIPDGRDKALGVTMMPLDQLVALSDVVSVHTPLTEETRGIVGAAQLAKMKPHAILINTARGECVDVDALAEVLRAGKIGGAGLDVLPVEPPEIDRAIIKLWQQEDPPVNLVITPHSAFYSEQGIEEMRTKAALEVKRVLLGEKPRNVVNEEYLCRPSVLRGQS